MWNGFGWYLPLLYQDIPIGIFVGLIVTFCIGTITILLSKGFKQGSWVPAILNERGLICRSIGYLLMVEYLLLLLCSTVIFQKVSHGISGFSFQPLWSYRAIENCLGELFAENMMNVMAFIPVGFLLGLAIKGIKWWQVLIVGMTISVTIEALQFFLKRGFSEVDDVMHNTLGCLIGFGACRMVTGVMKKFSFVK